MNIDHTKNIIDASNISFAYEDNKVLKDVSLCIHQGDYLGVVGPNGGGKTTLIKIILGLLKPDSGTINMFGIDQNKFKDWHKIGYVAQKATSFDLRFPITVREVVGMGRGKKTVSAALKEVDMEKYSKRLIGDLSGGQQQRVFIARALAQKPEIIFLDEPTSGIDINSQRDFYSLLKKLNQELNITIVLISHDIDVITNEVTEVANVNQHLDYFKNPKDYLKTIHQH
ncbi:metal ABC transporter ATP-binding protein [soil metagenome]